MQAGIEPIPQIDSTARSRIKRCLVSQQTLRLRSRVNWVMNSDCVVEIFQIPRWLQLKFMNNKFFCLPDRRCHTFKLNSLNRKPHKNKTSEAMFLIYEIMFNLFYGPNVQRQRKSWNAKLHAGLAVQDWRRNKINFSLISSPPTYQISLSCSWCN